MKYCIILLLTLAICVLPGCRTTEANYRAAYEVAHRKSEQKSPVEGTVYEKIRNESVESRMVAGNDTVPMNTVMIAAVKDFTNPDDVKHYSVAVNQFKQIFNARSQAQRLRDAGYPQATVVMTSEPLYYVIAGGADTAAEAMEIYHRVKKDKSVITKSPFPWVLKAARYPIK